MRLPVIDQPAPNNPAIAPAGGAAGDPASLTDRHGRGIGYLRLSLTAACAMRCLYCRPADFTNPRGERRLSPEQIEALVRYLAERHGLHKVRLTGGDPTSRADLAEILRRITAIDGIEDLAMTTHALNLTRRAHEYAAAGLRRVNVSLDTLDRDRFAELTGVDGLHRALEGLDVAEAAGLTPIKLNTVVVKGHNEADLPELVRFAAEREMTIRFIELMPMGPLAGKWAERYVPEAQMWRRIDPIVAEWRELPQGADAARRYRLTLDDGREATVGFITPMSCNFCSACNRIRIAADGTLYPCLMDRPGPSLWDTLVPRLDPEALDARLRSGLAGKAAEHPHDGHAVMTGIGG